MIGHADALEQRHGVLGALGRGVAPAVIHGQQDVLDGSEGGQELEELEDDAHRTAAPDGDLLLAEGMDGDARNEHLARGWAVDAGDDVDQRGFAAAGFADDGDKGAEFHLQVDAVEGGEGAGRAAIDLDHVAQQHKLCVGHRGAQGGGNAQCRHRLVPVIQYIYARLAWQKHFTPRPGRIVWRSHPSNVEDQTPRPRNHEVRRTFTVKGRK